MNWITWMSVLLQLRPAFKRERTFHWFLLSTMGLAMRNDLLGVSSIMRALGINKERTYFSFLRLFHSSGINLHLLTILWIKICFKIFAPFIVLCRGRFIIVIDGLKIGKEGRRMPGVKKLFQNSSNNSKPSYIWGHSCQGISLLVSTGISSLAIPLVQRIHEGLDDSNKSIVQKSIDLLELLPSKRLYLVGDAYYFSGKLSKCLNKRGIHLISRARSNAVAYRCADMSPHRGKGRPAVYGDKVRIKHLFQGPGFIKTKVSLYGKEEDIEVKEIDLISKSHKRLIKYILVRGHSSKVVLTTTDLTISAKEVVEIYGKRFKIEVSFKEMVHRIGTFSYRFWSTRVERSRKIKKKRDPRKENAYHLYIQFGVIVHGLLNYIALINRESIWMKFSGWLRTINPLSIPSEQIVMMALKEEYIDFTDYFKIEENFRKFFIENVSEEKKLRYYACG